MSPGRDEDLDWLYGRDPQQAEPERTRVMPDPYGTAAPQQRRAPYPRTPTHQTPQPRPGIPPSGAPRGRTAGGPRAPRPARPAKQRRPVRRFFRVLLILLLLFILWLIAVPAYA